MPRFLASHRLAGIAGFHRGITAIRLAPVAHDQLLDDEVEQGVVAKGVPPVRPPSADRLFQQMLVLLAMGRQLLIAILREDLLFEEEVLARHPRISAPCLPARHPDGCRILHVLEQAVGQQVELAVVRIDAGVAHAWAGCHCRVPGGSCPVENRQTLPRPWCLA